jgi:hypothetical protein
MIINVSALALPGCALYTKPKAATTCHHTYGRLGFLAHSAGMSGA